MALLLTSGEHREKVVTFARAEPHHVELYVPCVVLLLGLSLLWQILCPWGSEWNQQFWCDVEVSALTLAAAVLCRRLLKVVLDFDVLSLQVERTLSSERTLARLKEKELQAGVKEKELIEQVQRWQEEARKADLKNEAIRKQAGQQADEYMRLIEENHTLRTHLADFEILMGGAKKKHS